MFSIRESQLILDTVDFTKKMEVNSKKSGKNLIKKKSEKVTKGRIVKPKLKRTKTTPNQISDASLISDNEDYLNVENNSEIEANLSNFVDHTVNSANDKSNSRPNSNRKTAENVFKKKTQKVTKAGIVKSKAKQSKPIEKTISNDISLISDEENNDNLQLENNGEFPIWDMDSVLSEVTGVSQDIARNIVNLIEDDNTLPFIARYRKTMIDFMSPDKLQEIFDSYQKVQKMRQKSLSILRTLKKNNKLTKHIQNSIISARSISELQLLYDPLKSNNSIGEKMKNLGLEEAISTILNGKDVELFSLINSENKNIDQVKSNLIQGLANSIYKDASVLQTIRKLKTTVNIIVECSKAQKRKTKSELIAEANCSKFKNDSSKYDLYMNFKMKADYIKPHQILAINRGEAAKALSVKVIVDDWFLRELIKFCKNKWRHFLIEDSTRESYKKYVHPWICRQVRSEMTSKATKESILVFCSNLKRLLLTTPIKSCNIVGIDPGFRNGCKVAIIGTNGNVLETFIVHPDFNNKNDFEGVKLRNYVIKHNCGIIALGNGKACRETEGWLKNLNFSQNVKIVIVPEQGASVYSCSPEAAKEFPGLDPNLISAISLARRVLDPLSELIKVNVKHIGVGMYQHDIHEKLLNEALDNIVINCVSFVGADLNTASHTLLSKIAGLSSKKALSICEFREKNQGFKTREQLMKVPGIGPKTYTQCAGFLRVKNSSNKLDNTWIHPESYDLTFRLIQQLNLNTKQIGTEDFIDKINSGIKDLDSLASKLKCTRNDLELITEALSQLPSEDPIRNVKPIYSMSITSFKDLTPGLILTGVVNNVTTFGVFVDCGVGQNGLIHKSQFGSCGNPEWGDKVEVQVLSPITENKLPLKLIQIIK